MLGVGGALTVWIAGQSWGLWVPSQCGVQGSAGGCGCPHCGECRAVLHLSLGWGAVVAELGLGPFEFEILGVLK